MIRRLIILLLIVGCGNKNESIVIEFLDEIKALTPEFLNQSNTSETTDLLWEKRSDIIIKYFSEKNKSTGIYFINGKLITDWTTTDVNNNIIRVLITHTDGFSYYQKKQNKVTEVLFIIEDGLISNVNPNLPRPKFNDN